MIDLSSTPYASPSSVIGFGNAVVPGPDEILYPVILSEMPKPQLRASPRHTVVAQKLETLTSLGMLKSRK